MSFATRIRTVFVVLMVAALTVSLVDLAYAKSENGGRVGNPSRLRTSREPRPPGRKMKRASIPEPDQKLPLHTTALIPNPEPSKRGGSGFQRNGKYFYQTPRDVELTRAKAGSGYKESVPRPEKIGTERMMKDGRRKGSKD